MTRLRPCKSTTTATLSPGSTQLPHLVARPRLNANMPKMPSLGRCKPAASLPLYHFVHRRRDQRAPGRAALSPSSPHQQTRARSWPRGRFRALHSVPTLALCTVARGSTPLAAISSSSCHHEYIHTPPYGLFHVPGAWSCANMAEKTAPQTLNLLQMIISNGHLVSSSALPRFGAQRDRNRAATIDARCAACSRASPCLTDVMALPEPPCGMRRLQQTLAKAHSPLGA